MKTKLTKQIEHALVERTAGGKGVIGALEVTPDYDGGRKGYQRADYVEVNSDGQITCYEIKVSLADLNSKNKLTFMGDRNYLVVPKKLADDLLSWRMRGTLWDHVKHQIFSKAGLISYVDNDLSIDTPDWHSKTVSLNLRIAFLTGIARSACRDFQKLYLEAQDEN